MFAKKNLILLFGSLVCLLTLVLLRTNHAISQPATSEYFRLWKLAELPLQTGFALYYGADAYPGVMGQGDYVIKLEKPLPPGKYRVQIRTFNVMKLEVSLGGERKAVPIVRNLFSDPLDIETKEPASTLTVHVNEPGGNPIVQAVFLTSNLDEKMGQDDTITKVGEAPKVATQIPPAVVREGNYLENSSFEVGPGHGWGKFWNDQLDSTTAFDGKTSLRMPLTTQNIGSDVGWIYKIENFESKFYRLPPGKYTVSAYMKADRPTRARGYFGLVGHPDNPNQSGDGTPLGDIPNITTEWKRFAYTVDVPEAPGNFWAVTFRAEWRVIERGMSHLATLEEVEKADFKDIPKNIWIDAIQVERADAATEYSPRGGVEAGVGTDKPGFIFYDNEPSEVDVLVYNPGKSRETLNVDYRIENYYDATVKQETLAVPLNGETHLKRTITLPKDKRGIFRVLVSHNKDRQSMDELVYSMLPPNRNLNAFHPAGRTGSDTGFDPYTLKILKRANINWMIAKGIGRMENVQPELGKYVWYDAELQKALDAKMMVLGQVYINTPPPYIKDLMPPVEARDAAGRVWDPAKKQKMLEMWSDYVTKVVSHYKGRINHWEVTNEPYFYANPQEHGEMLRVASAAIRKADPKIHIVGFSSANYVGGWFEQAVRAAQPEWYDGISGHFYETHPAALRPLGEILEKQNKTGWQTEAGPTFPSFYKTLPTYQQLTNAQHHANPSDQAVRDAFTINALQGELRCYGIGRIDHYFHYFTRFYNATPTEPTRRGGSGKEDVEYSGALRPYAVARSIASYFLDGAKIDSEWRSDPRVTMALFDRGKSTVGYMFSADGRLLHLKPNQLANWRIYDWQGNAETIKDRISIDRFPRYFAIDLPPAQVRLLMEGEGVVTSQLGLDARLVASQDGKGSALQLLLHNELATTQPVSLTFGGVLGGYVGNSQSAMGLQLKPGERRLLELPMLALPAVRAMVVSARAGDEIVNFQLRLNNAEARPGPVAAAPTNAFNFDLVRSGNGNRMSEADFTPTFQASYDAENLHLAGAIKDDMMSFAPGKIIPGQNDGMNFQIAAQTPQRLASTDQRERLARVASVSDITIAVAPTSNTAAIAEIRTSKGATSLPAKMTKTADGYRLEVSVPWQRLGMAAPKVGESVTFNAVAFDADGPNPEYKTEWPWAGGPNFLAPDPSGWGDLFFLSAR